MIVRYSCTLFQKHVLSKISIDCNVILLLRLILIRHQQSKLKGITLWVTYCDGVKLNINKHTFMPSGGPPFTFVKALTSKYRLRTSSLSFASFGGSSGSFAAVLSTLVAPSKLGCGILLNSFLATPSSCWIILGKSSRPVEHL